MLRRKYPIGGCLACAAVLTLVSGCALAAPAPATSSPAIFPPTAGPSPSPFEGPVGPTSTPPEAMPPVSYMLAQPTPQHPIGGGHAETGPFTFTLFLYRDDRLDPTTWAAPWCYSEVPGVGVYMDWVYRGPSIQGPVVESWGPESDLSPAGRFDSLADGYHGGRAGGGIRLPGDASPGDTVGWAMTVETPEGCYGAALRFVLVEGPHGFEATNISVEALPPH